MKNAFLPTVSFLAIGALVFRWTKASVTFVCKSCLTSAIMLAWSLSTSALMWKRGLKADICQLKWQVVMILWHENWNVTWDQINRPSGQATNQPYKPIANKHCATSQTTCQRINLPSNIYKLNNPRLSWLYILIYQMTSNVICMVMIGYQPTIKNHQNQGYTSTCTHLYMNSLITWGYLLQILSGPLHLSSKQFLL